jgi:negative regulator of sigma-B (phosphoserine phosphatase)
LREDWPRELERGIAGAPHADEERSGDVAVFAPTSAGGLVALIDGLGHGPEAADAAQACAAVAEEHADAEPAELFRHCHEALRSTRGAVMTAAWFDVGRARLTWAGVGNVEARLVRVGPEAREDTALVFGGVLGYRMPRIRPATMKLQRGDKLVMATDGIDAAFSPALAGGGTAQAIAERIFALHSRGSDDALAIVVRYR